MLNPGDKLAQFEIQVKLGEGGMGAVYRAQDTKLGRVVALKVLPPEFLGDKERLERFAREARSLPTLHAGLVWAARKWFQREPHIHNAMTSLLREIHAVYGWKSKLAAPVFGRVLLRTLKKEEERLREGWTYEPPAIYEKNAQAVALDRALRLRGIVPEIQWVSSEPVPATGG